MFRLHMSDALMKHSIPFQLDIVRCVTKYPSIDVAYPLKLFHFTCDNLNDPIFHKHVAYHCSTMWHHCHVKCKSQRTSSMQQIVYPINIYIAMYMNWCSWFVNNIVINKSFYMLTNKRITDIADFKYSCDFEL